MKVVELAIHLRFLTEANSDEREFANYLLEVENGNISVDQSLGKFKSKLSNDFCLESDTISDLRDLVYADLKINFTNPMLHAKGTIVIPTNEVAQL